jgi:small ligand-binding sensory domain FIST
MAPFLHAHAPDADWPTALRRIADQIAQQTALGATTPTLGFAYFTDHHRPQAEALLAALRQQWPDVAWVGASGIGVAGSGTEYFDIPGLCVMLAALPRAQFRVFSGARPLGHFAAQAALVHADPMEPELPALLAELSAQTDDAYLFGGIASATSGPALQLADGLWCGGLSGVAFGADVALVSRVTQGCQPIGPVRQVTAAEGNLVLSLDNQPALDQLLADTGIDLAQPQQALPLLRATLAGLSDASGHPLDRGGAFGTDTRVRHLIGLDATRRGVALAEQVAPGMQLAFCSRHAEAARRDLVRICSEIREELEPQGDEPGRQILGAVYISCNGRGGPHFGGPSAELQIVRHALGEVPLVGFFANGEIARHHLYGYTGVLTVFVTP